MKSRRGRNEVIDDEAADRRLHPGTPQGHAPFLGVYSKPSTSPLLDNHQCSPFVWGIGAKARVGKGCERAPLFSISPETMGLCRLFAFGSPSRKNNFSTAIICTFLRCVFEVFVLSFDG